MVRGLRGSKGIEKTKVRGQVIDKFSKTLGSHGGDRGSKPLGTANTYQYHSSVKRPPVFCPNPYRPALSPRFSSGLSGQAFAPSRGTRRCQAKESLFQRISAPCSVMTALVLTSCAKSIFGELTAVLVCGHREWTATPNMSQEQTFPIYLSNDLRRKALEFLRTQRGSDRSLHPGGVNELSAYAN
jgi:hypothetical protein